MKKLLFSVIILMVAPCLLAERIHVGTTYVEHVLPQDQEPVYLVTKLVVGSKANAVTFEKKDSLFRLWQISGNDLNGTATLFASKERGIGWTIGVGPDTLKVIIGRDYKNTFDPRIISITTNFASGLFIVENFAPECNSLFKVYSLKNSWDADVEYTGDYGLIIENGAPCKNGVWGAKAGKLKIPDKVRVVAVFTAVMTQNIRYLFKSS